MSGDVTRPGGTVLLRGVTGSGQPEADLHNAVQDAAPTAAVDWQVGAAMGPYCPVLNLLRPYARPFGVSAGGVGLGLQGDRTNLVTDDPVISRVTMPEFPSHLQLDYLASDGTVLHMHSSTARPYPAGSQQRVGDPRPPAFEGWKVFEPYGTDLVVEIGRAHV